MHGFIRKWLQAKADEIMGDENRKVYDAKQGIINILAERYIRGQLDVSDNQIGYFLDVSGLDDYAFTGGRKAIFELEKQVKIIKNFLNASD